MTLFSSPRGLALTSNHCLLVNSSAKATIVMINAQGEEVKRVGSSGHLAGQFSTPFGIITDRNDRVLVADSYNRRIQVLSSSLEVLSEFGKGELAVPIGLSIDSQNNLIVGDSGNSRVAYFDNNFDFIWCKQDTVRISKGGYLHVAVDPFDNLITSDIDKGIVSFFGPDGEIISSKEVSRPAGVAVDATGTVAVVGHAGFVKLFEGPERTAKVDQFDTE